MDKTCTAVDVKCKRWIAVGHSSSSNYISFALGLREWGLGLILEGMGGGGGGANQAFRRSCVLCSGAGTQVG